MKKLDKEINRKKGIDKAYKLYKNKLSRLPDIEWIKIPIVFRNSNSSYFIMYNFFGKVMPNEALFYKLMNQALDNLKNDLETIKDKNLGTIKINIKTSLNTNRIAETETINFIK